MRLSRLLGVLGAAISYPFILVSILFSPWFSIYDNALSDLGNTSLNGSISWVFNAGLIISGFLIACFALTKFVNRIVVRIVSWALPLTVAGVDLDLIGIFPENRGEIHGVVSVIFFTLMILGMLIYGFVSLPLGSQTIRAIAFAFAITSIVIWFAPWPWKGVAIQETLTSIMGSLWLILVAVNRQRASK